MRRSTVNATHPLRHLEVWMQIKDPKKIAKLMVIQGISHRDMAEAVGYKSHGHIGRIFRGEIGTVTPEKAALIANVLGVGVDDLFLVRVSSDAGHNDHRKGAA
jgi:transcriptional regulator with XRE-family HTH domain